MTAACRTVTVALDLLGGDGGPDVVVAGAVRAVGDDPQLRVVLVGPPDRARAAVAAHGLDGVPAHVPGDPEAAPALSVAQASGVVGMSDDPVRAVRSRPGITARVCAALVASRAADATVSAGHSGAAVAAATFVLGRMRGAARPTLAVVLPALAGPVVLLDAGASMVASPDLLAGSALAGAAYAQALGLESPRVGLLTVGAEPGKGDQVRVEAHELLAALPLRYVGPVEGYQVALGGVADVVVTDGFTGNVVLKSVEGALAWAVESVGRRYGDPGPAREVLREAAHGPYAGGLLLGVSGVSVVAHGAADGRAVAACVALAARAVRGGVVPRTENALAELVRLRRDAAGLP